MAFITVNPTANQSPDATLGGLAVTAPTNTGHSSTVTSASGGAAQTKSCRWFSFQNVGGSKSAITLKVDHTTAGALAGPSPNNFFALDYSVNNGGSWVNAATRSGFTSSQGPTTFSVALNVTQDITQVQVRVDYFAETFDIGDSASVTATIASIKLEVVTIDVSPIVMT